MIGVLSVSYSFSPSEVTYSVTVIVVSHDRFFLIADAVRALLAFDLDLENVVENSPHGWGGGGTLKGRNCDTALTSCSLGEPSNCLMSLLEDDSCCKSCRSCMPSPSCSELWPSRASAKLPTVQITSSCFDLLFRDRDWKMLLNWASVAVGGMGVVTEMGRWREKNEEMLTS